MTRGREISRCAAAIDAADALTQLLGGVIVVVAPFALGRLASHIGLPAAFAVEPVLIVSSGLLLAAGARLAGAARRATGPQSRRSDIL